MQVFRDLKVWQQSHQLVLSIYRLTTSFPSEEKYGLTSQLRRAAVSIPNNIAEGSKRKSQIDFAHFLNMAEGSAAEVDYLLLLAQDLKYAPPESLSPLVQSVSEISKMLYALRIKTEQRA